MNDAFYVGAVGLDAQQRALEVVANNLANINTPGFKRSSVQFAELVGASRDAAENPTAATDRSAGYEGVSVAATPRVFTQGDLKQTGNPLDIAIEGSGYLEVLGPSGHSLLWRGGTLKVNDDGYLATSDGLQLQNAISVPQSTTSISIASDGTVSAVTNGTSERIGQLQLVVTKNTDGLAEAGNGYYEATDAAETFSSPADEDGAGTFVQGAIEGANVQLTDEMTSLLMIQRAYGADAQVIQAADQLMSIVNGLRR